MTRVLLFLFLTMNLVAQSQNKGNYILIINNDSISIDLNQPAKHQTAAGATLDIQLVQPSILTYSDDMISFKHHKSLGVSNTKIQTGIEQCMILKSTGNGFMVQKYSTIDPSSLTQLMLNEITKESISYGYTKKEKAFRKKLKSGQTIKGIQATLSYKGEEQIFTVATYGEKDQGIVVVTILINEEFKDDAQIIDLFLDTLRINDNKATRM
ncbi:MAG: hypothetical protein AB8E82_03930 [Aureispira sp.]